MKTLFAAIVAIAIASPALAWDNQLNDAIQTYEVDQQLNNLARQATQSNQNTFNNNPIFNHQPIYGTSCPYGAWCLR